MYYFIDGIFVRFGNPFVSFLPIFALKSGLFNWTLSLLRFPGIETVSFHFLDKLSLLLTCRRRRRRLRDILLSCLVL